MIPAPGLAAFPLVDEGIVFTEGLFYFREDIFCVLVRRSFRRLLTDPASAFRRSSVGARRIGWLSRGAVFDEWWWSSCGDARFLLRMVLCANHRGPLATIVTDRLPWCWIRLSHVATIIIAAVMYRHWLPSTSIPSLRVPKSYTAFVFLWRTSRRDDSFRDTLYETSDFGGWPDPLTLTSEVCGAMTMSASSWNSWRAIARWAFSIGDDHRLISSTLLFWFDFALW